MGLQIESGTGNGNSVGVTDQNRLQTSAVMVSKEHQVNHTEGMAFSMGVEVTPTAAGDCFLYVKNLSDHDMIISEFMLNATTSETITFKVGDSGTPAYDAVITPVNRNAGSGNVANITAVSGVDITGLSGGSPIMSMFLKGGESSVRIAPTSTFIIPQNKVFTGYVTTGGLAVKVGMGISFHKSGE